jgi:hypothetical protein
MWTRSEQLKPKGRGFEVQCRRHRMKIGPHVTTTIGGNHPMGPLRDPEGPWVIIAALIVGSVGGVAGSAFAGLYDLMRGDAFVVDGRWFVAGFAGGILLFLVNRRIARSMEYCE